MVFEVERVMPKTQGSSPPLRLYDNFVRTVKAQTSQQEIKNIYY